MSYLQRFWKTSRLGTVAVCTFALMSVFANWRGDEVTPFFVWGMFSEPLTLADTSQALCIDINGSPYPYPEHFAIFTEFMATNSLPKFHKLQTLGEDPLCIFLRDKLGGKYEVLSPLLPHITNHPSDSAAYVDWLFRYWERLLDTPIQRIEVSRQYYQITAEGIDTLQRIPLYHFRRE